MHDAPKVALVVGSTGVSGSALVDRLAARPGWQVIAGARRPATAADGVTPLRLDLADPAALRDAAPALRDVTHVFYTAYAKQPTIALDRTPNTAMFANLLPVLTEAAPQLAHVCLLQGTKYYGQYLGAFKTPAREDDPRPSVPHFYYDQQDMLAAAQPGSRWSWSVARPHVICGYAIGNPLNLIAVIGVYAAILKKLGRPLTFPGKPGAFTSIYQASDAGLLAHAMEWMATTPSCANQAFNVTNGDFFRYEHLWPHLAAYFGMEAGGVETVDLVELMRDKDDLWAEITREHALAPHPLHELIDWSFANYAFSNDWDVMSDTNRLRQHGFLEFVDSYEMFTRQLSEFRQHRIIP